MAKTEINKGDIEVDLDTDDIKSQVIEDKTKYNRKKLREEENEWRYLDLKHLPNG